MHVTQKLSQRPINAKTIKNKTAKNEKTDNLEEKSRTLREAIDKKEIKNHKKSESNDIQLIYKIE